MDLINLKEPVSLNKRIKKARRKSFWEGFCKTSKVRGGHITLIRVALGFKIQLLFKTILHHDAFSKFFFLNMQRDANSMTILFEF